MREPSRLLFSERDRDILEALVLRVRVFSLPQLGRTWWGNTANPDLNAWQRMQMLQRDNLVVTFSGISHPELPLQKPVATWSPGTPEPAFGQISYRLQSRWALPPVATKYVTATRTARRHFGGAKGRLPRERELTHDIHLAAVYLRLRHENPSAAQQWISDETIQEQRGHTREKLPDAILNLPSGRLVIEFGGAYGKEKLQGFHDYCEQQALPYEIW